MRDYKPKEYYEKVLNGRYELLSYYQKRFDVVGGVQLDKAKIGLTINLVNIIHVKYSIGEPIKESYKDICEVISILEKYWNPNLVRFKKGRKPIYYDMYILEYNFFMRKLLSLMVLNDLDKKYFEIIRKLIDRDKVKDGLYDYLLSYKFSDRKISKQVYPEKPKNQIIDIILEEDKEACIKRIKNYIDKQWYKTYKNSGFYNSHMLPEDKYSFYGYWAFEVAAIVKIKDLDDSSFRDNQYYPKDLLKQ